MKMQSTFQCETSLPSTHLYGTVMILSAVINVSSTKAFSSRDRKKWNKKGTATLRNGIASLTRAPSRCQTPAILYLKDMMGIYFTRN